MTAERGRRPIKFRIAYLIERIGDPVILAYISHEDQEAVMKRRGLL